MKQIKDLDIKELKVAIFDHSDQMNQHKNIVEALYKELNDKMVAARADESAKLEKLGKEQKREKYE